MTDWNAVPTFGVADTTLPHVIRPSAYALIAGSPGQLAIVHTPAGVYLPGGGIMGAESPEATVCREAQEECGLAIRLAHGVALRSIT